VLAETVMVLLRKIVPLVLKVTVPPPAIAEVKAL
jgi:hypothetical protein